MLTPLDWLMNLTGELRFLWKLTITLHIIVKHLSADFKA